MVCPPPTDPIIELAKTQMQVNSVNRIRAILDDNKICYYFNDGILENHHSGWCSSSLTVYIGKRDNLEGDLLDKFTIFPQPQLSLKCSKKAPRGYIICNLNSISRNFSRAEASNAVYYCYSLEEDAVVFKPMAFLLKYAITTNINRDLTEKNKKYVKETYVRVDPKPRELIKTHPIELPNGYAAGANHAPVKKEPPFTFHFGYTHSSFVITHNEATIISQKEMEDFLANNNHYSDAWKLKFKVAKNILSQGR